MISTFFEAYKNILCEVGTSTGNTGTVEITMVSSFQKYIKKYIHFLHTFFYCLIFCHFLNNFLFVLTLNW